LGTRNSEPLVFITGDAPRGVIGADGNFGIGTQAPGAKLHVAGDGMVDNNLNIGENLYVGDALEVAGMARIAGFTHIDNDALVSGNAQISGALEVNGEAFIEGFTEINDNAQVNGNAQVRGELLLGPAQEARLAQTGVDLLIESQSGNVNIEADNELMMTVSNVEVEVKKRLIVTGADLAERFTVTDGSKQAIPGYVMAIDTEHPGALVVSRKAYNRAVAGIVSGAGGVNTAMLLGQEGTLADGDVAVAITGRVYCYADADGGAIAPGDLLTTAELPGHVMKAQDYERAQGAIVGKAMTPLAEGQGLVLVLITLQ
jgi:carbonic anhydrase/acetyltransferase-like protein (isoleucine patch superfamily)